MSIRNQSTAPITMRENLIKNRRANFLLRPPMFVLALSLCWSSSARIWAHPAASQPPLKVFVLTGQSNMQGHAKISTFDVIGMDPATAPMLAAMQNDDGTPMVCEQVWISAIGCADEERRGQLTVGFGADDKDFKIGPEFTFGIYMQKLLDEPILIIKTAWGGKSLHTDFRPPSAGPYEFNESQLKSLKDQGKDIVAAKAERAAATGVYYRLMIDHVKNILGDIKRVYPEHDPEQGYELAGMVWFQGWNDMVDGSVYPHRNEPGGYDRYSDVLTDFIRDVREDLAAPKLPFVIGVMGAGGPVKLYPPEKQRYAVIHSSFRDAMAAPASLPEFKGNVATVLTEQYWDRDLEKLKAHAQKIQQAVKSMQEEGQLEAADRPATLERLQAESFTPRELTILNEGTSNAEYHYLGSAKIIGQIGKAFAETLFEMMEHDVVLPSSQASDGNGSVVVTGEAKQWHKLTLTLDGPFAHETDDSPNPFTDLRMTVTFSHPDGDTFVVPGYFAADGNAANSSAESGTAWRAHFAPDKIGTWTYAVSFQQGSLAALDDEAASKPVTPFDGVTGLIEVAGSDKQGRDLRAQGRLQYVGKHYLQFAGSGKYFLKAGADAPETLLAFADFDNTVAGKPKQAPLKTWAPHIQDWNEGDPTWQGGKGKGLIGAINYLSSKGCNAFSFLTYNAGGDGDNVWPFIERNDKLHYDCSKLDQWGIVFDDGTSQGMYLHFKLQETENDDNSANGRNVPESLDGGNLGIQRKLYCRELVARYAHNLALNWNLGEENTQTTAQQQAMINYLAKLDPYGHNIVVHTYPNQQEKVYHPLLGNQSKLTGVSLQNSSLPTTHAQTLKWVRESANAGKPWVVAFDESGSAAHGQTPDLGYQGFDGHDRTGKMAYTQHEVRQQTLWGTLMAGGAGNEYYFGYQFAENDLVCEDWRSRDQSWDYCRIAINFFHDHEIPFWEMKNADERVGNAGDGTSKFCFAKHGDTYLVYLAEGGESQLDLSSDSGEFTVRWFNPRIGGDLQTGTVHSVTGGDAVSLGQPPTDITNDWLAVLRKDSQ